MYSASGGRRPRTGDYQLQHIPAELRVLELGAAPSSSSMSRDAAWRRPVCRVCCESAATVFCRNDRAWLCDACDAAVHLSNPLSACHEILPLNSCLLQQISMDSTWDDMGMSDTLPESVLLSSQIVPAALVAASESGLQNQQVDKRGVTSTMDRVAQLPVVELLPVECGSVALSQSRYQDLKIGSECVEAVDTRKEKAARRLGSLCQNERGTMKGDGPGSHGRNGPHWFVPAASHCRVPGGVQYLQIPTVPFHPFSSAVPCTFSSIMETKIPMATIKREPPSDVWLARKARVARYLQKKKNRSWGNKIRYESRKAYAENRPRIKGRFARPDEFKAYLEEQEASKTEQLS